MVRLVSMVFGYLFGIPRVSYLCRAVFCEFFGTFLLVYFGLSSILPSQADAQLDNLLAAGLCFASVVIALSVVIGPVSGCHINPAVTLALLLVGRIAPITSILYVIAQLAGSVAGAWYVKHVSPPEWVAGASLGMTSPVGRVSGVQGVGIECVNTLLLVLVVLGVTHRQNQHEGATGNLAGGIAVLACVYASGPYTGASLNPARSFGPALIYKDFEEHWIYWVGPLLGSVVGALIHILMISPVIEENYCEPALDGFDPPVWRKSDSDDFQLTLSDIKRPSSTKKKDHDISE